MEEADPITAAWVRAAAGMGFEVRRSDDAWAAYDGAGTITVSDDGGLDADDSAAALILHELCHFAIQGAASAALPDWGLNTADPGPEEHRRERSALRVQRTLLRRRGLEERLAPTTEYRGFYEDLGERPLEGDPLALAAFDALSANGWLPVLDEALRVTADVPACGDCGACCHAGFGALEIPRDDPFADQWPELLAATPEEGWELPREDGFCPMVVRSVSSRAWACSEYGERPWGCVRFEAGGRDCKEARRRAGVDPPA